ncbi:twin-arginine translocase TatA/TatE family subunit [Kribbella turkmenica]|uniref:Twin-arginine translocase TatA/TatE family subunit n=1 Tax=Kribbella turkmenica TaxID=2530375 RepID=A0A4R4WPP2_9ACTN|nr:twin-arginine translocase TatA/TatE family subunit [Kribbella turkmenica]TDD19294.1 twin-arginine translocase TatA/TatE family subunit [Kribbella turkmenica]
MVPLLELPQGGEWIVILVIVVLLFGAKKLPELSRNAARALVEFERATSEARSDGAREAAAGQSGAAPPVRRADR